MKKIIFLGLFIMLKLYSHAQSPPTVFFDFPSNNQVFMPSSLPFGGDIYHIATISSDLVFTGQGESLPSLDWGIQSTKFTATFSENIVFQPIKIWWVSTPNWNTFNPISTPPGDIGNGPPAFVIRPTTTYQYKIYVEIKANSAISNCKSVTFNFKTRHRDIGSSWQHDVSTTLYFNRYVGSTAAQNTPDLFIKDNDFDIGHEPYWQPSADITKSVSIMNDLTSARGRTSSGLNPSLAFSNFAQRSTLGNLNKMNVWIENRGCAATTQSATMHAYWTVARVFEPWGSHWHNYQDFNFADQNFTTWRNPATGTDEPKLMGNHITISDPLNYRSAIQSVSIPAGIAPTKFDGTTHTGGHIATISWNPPDANWYTGNNTIFQNNSRPVLCYLAVINESGKTNDGFYQPYASTSDASITDFALYNNNVATVNSYLATPNGLYKTSYANNSYRSITGTIRINNAEARNVINLSVNPALNQPNFNNNGSIFILFDEFLWENWETSSNFSGEGFEIVSPQVVKITSASGIATFTGLILNEDEEGTLGVLFEYDGNNTPAEDYIYGLSLGAFDESPTNQIGSPTYFNTHVLSTPIVDDQEDANYSQITSLNNLEGLCDFITAYPNPIDENVTVGFSLKEFANTIDIKIYDLTLKEVRSKLYNFVSAGSQTLTLDASSLPQGQYLLKLTVDGKHQTIKISKK